MNEAGETGSEPALPASPRHFGQLPDSDISDDFDETSPEDDWPIDVEALREALREAEADLAAGRTFGEDDIRARYGLRRSHAGSAEQETADLLRSPENARRLMEAVARDKGGRPPREKEVDEHVAAGLVSVHEDANAFLDHLDHLDAQADHAQAEVDPESS